MQNGIVQRWLGVFAFAAIIFATGHYLSTELSGVRPTKAYANSSARPHSNSPARQADSQVAMEELASKAANVDYHDPEVDTLRQTAKADATNIEARKRLVSILEAKLLDSSADSQAIFEIISLHGEILDSDPKNLESLLSMADISFNFKVVDKATAYYKKYLELSPDDFEARTRYAAALTLSGSAQSAVEELSKVLKSQPEHFGALVNLSIANAELGNKQEAILVAQRAIAHAPDEEAKARFGSFVESLNQESSQSLKIDSHSKPSLEMVSNATLSKDAGAIVELIKNNKIAGPKFIEALQADQQLVVKFQQFPMDKMPEAIRQKFISQFQQQLDKSEEIGSIQFQDADTGAVLQILNRAS